MQSINLQPHSTPLHIDTSRLAHKAVQSVPNVAGISTPSIVLLKLLDYGLLLVELCHLAGGLAVLVLQLLIRAPAMPLLVIHKPHGCLARFIKQCLPWNSLLCARSMLTLACKVCRSCSQRQGHPSVQVHLQAA